jgi:serine/threonine protein kinase
MKNESIRRIIKLENNIEIYFKEPLKRIIDLLKLILNKYYFKQDEVYLNLVMEYVPDTLSRVIRFNNKNKINFSPSQLKILTYQMWRALAYL